MTKPVIVTRADKGSALTWTEGDTNLTNLRDATIGITDGTNSGTLDLNDTLAFTAGTNVTLSYNASSKALTINASGGGATTLDGLSDVSTTGAVNGNYLNFNGTSWTPADIYGIYVDDSSTNNATYFLTFTGGYGAANQGLSADGGLQYNPSTGKITSTIFSSSLDITGTITAGGSIGSSGQVLKSTGSGVQWATPTSGTVTSVGGTGTVNGLTLSGTVTSSGNLTLGGTLSGIGNSALTNSTITFGSTSVSLGETVSALNSVTIGNSSATTGKFTSLEFKNPLEPIYDLGTTGGTIAPDAANGSVQKITLNSALTINAFTNPTAGESITLIIYGGTAYTSITSTMKFAGGIKTLTGTAGCIDILSIYYDGTNYFASLGKGYA